MFRSRLFLRTFSALVAGIISMAAAIYLFSVPLIQETAYDIELNASQTILDNVFEMASKIQFNLEAHRALALEGHKRQLKNIVSMATGYVAFNDNRAKNGEISYAEARRLMLEGLRTFTYGNNDYVWVMDYKARLLSHPDPQFQDVDGTKITDSQGKTFLPEIVAIAQRDGEGYYTYPWSRLGRKTPSQKLSYFRNLPDYGLIIGSGVYLDDVEEEVAQRKAAAIEDLRQALRNIRIARTGYIYIFDASDHMLIHPSANLENTLFGSLPNPVSGQSIAKELREAAASNKPLYYKWDKPTDQGNYVYEKLSWVRHFEGFDWYIASSVYTEELRRSSDILGDRILKISIAVLLLASLSGYWAVRTLVRPLNQLAATAMRVRSGDLSATSGIRRDDEIGVLAAAFDGMIGRLRASITVLDSHVRSRTVELESAQAALTEIEARQRLILNAIPAAIAYIDQQQLVRFANARWIQLVRGTHSDPNGVLGLPLADCMGRSAYAVVGPQVEKTLAGHQTTFEYAYVSPAGTPTVIKTTLIPEFGPDGEAVALFVLSLDITDEKETERHLLEAQRLKAVGQLSGGLAHDFNNLLSIVIGNLSAARDKFATVEGLTPYLEPSLRAAYRGADITNRLLAFARQQPLAPSAVDVCALVREAELLLRRSMPPGITIDVGSDECACHAFVDQGQLTNAVVNLAFNARDAMPKGGTLSISVQARHYQKAMPFDEPVPPGLYAEIRIADTGQGFAPEVLARAFEPFFTTKAQGSGLGLSMVYGFVKQSRGFIRIASQPEQGTIITILLPAAEKVEEAATAALPAPEAIQWQGELVLLVEDNEDVRHMIRGQLTDQGLAVLEASSGDEAAELLEAVPDIALVVSDVLMPGNLSGIDLARRVRRYHPAVGIVLLSGFALEAGEWPRELADVPLLRKPWQPQQLLQALAGTRRDGGEPPPVLSDQI
ncbi:cache domain-containing protein [Insolitispirillum peregrinum]|uniref:cache domain-containing protein n=1 Tax=Insolitispirillum peregrinum TaxID=80876 RepID=UPI003A8EEB34